MKKFTLSVLVCLVCLVSVLFSYYMTRETEVQNLSVENVYEMACASGYNKTLTEFIDEFRGAVGADGKGVKHAEINSDGHLIITYTDNTSVDAGAISVGSITVNADMSGEAINRALSSSVSIFAERSDGNFNTGGGIIYKLDREAGTAIIVTNNHVLYDNSVDAYIPNGNITAYLYGMEYPAFAMSCEYIGGSFSTDIAVIRIRSNEIIKNSSATAAQIFDSELVSVLDRVVAVGNPGGNGLSLVSGAISMESENRYLNIGASGGRIFMRVIRFDASVNKGNSGGGLYDSLGRLVGIVTARDSSSDGVSFAIPSNVIVSIADNILHYCGDGALQKGKLIKLGLGLEVRGATVYYDEASDRTVRVQEVFVKSVDHGSSAEAMGLIVGDRILSVTVDGRECIVTAVHQAPEMNYLAFEGSTITYKVLRGSTQMTFTLTVPAGIGDLS